jgi:hypothetical protein
MHEKLHLDHITPVAAGGTNEPSNLQYVHEACNLRKMTSPMEIAKRELRLRDLRLVTSRMSENNNRAIRNGETTSIWEVLTWQEQEKRWQAQIWANDCLEHLGYFKNEEDAHKTYHQAYQRF